MSSEYIQWEIQSDKCEQGYMAYLHDPEPRRTRGIEMQPPHWLGVTAEAAEAALRESLYSARIERMCKLIGDESLAMRAFLHFSLSSAAKHARERPIYADIRSGLSKGHGSVISNAVGLTAAIMKLTDQEKDAINRGLLGRFKQMPENPLETLGYILSILRFGGDVYVTGKDDPAYARYLPPEGVRTVKDRLSRDKILYCHSAWRSWTGVQASLGADSRFMVAMEVLMPALGIHKEDARKYVTVSVKKYGRQTII